MPPSTPCSPHRRSTGSQTRRRSRRSRVCCARAACSRSCGTTGTTAARTRAPLPIAPIYASCARSRNSSRHPRGTRCSASAPSASSRRRLSRTITCSTAADCSTTRVRSAGSRGGTSPSSRRSWSASASCCPRAPTRSRTAPTSYGRAVSELAFSFGRIAAAYDDVRPEYAPEALARAEEALGLDAGSRVVDLAAGSGKLTRALAGRFAEVVAVEPNDDMRAILAGRSADVRVLAGTAERMPLADDFADAVFAGDAFHWFDGPAAVAELDRVLRPGGGVALLWNLWWEDGDDGTSDSLEPPLPAAARALFDEVYVSSGRAAARAEKADHVADFAGSPFGRLEFEAFEQRRQLSGAEVINLYSTTSAVASLPPDERDELKQKLLALLDAEYLLRITTVLYWGRRG